MSRRVLLGIADHQLTVQVTALASEAGGLEVVGTALDTDEVGASLDRLELDAVILHEELGPLPPLELIRQLAAQHPGVGFLLVAREATPELLRAALRAGARDVLAQPLTVEALAEAVETAAGLGRAVRERMVGESLAQVASNIGGRIVAVAGAKGGVGATTIAVHLAMAAARHDADHPSCLVELDLQSGDVRALLDVSSRRSVADLVAVADEVTVRSLDDTLYIHPSGLRVLLSPEHGEDGEDVGRGAMRQIMGALKFQYDIVICDVGSVMTGASAVAIELADTVLVVTTPDVPSLRAANRLLALWERLNVRSEGASILLNRVHKETEIQPEFARRVLNAPVCETTVPSGFRELEAALNTGEPDRVEQGSMRRAFDALAQEVGVAEATQRRRRLSLRTRPRPAGAETGQVSVEAAGSTFIIAFVFLAVWQIVLVGYTMQLAGNSARSAARGYAVSETVEEVRARATDPLPQSWRDDAKVQRQPHGVRVSLAVPLVIPGISSPIRVADRERTVVEDEPLPEMYLPTTTTTTPAAPQPPQ